MKVKLFILMNHKLTQAQYADAVSNLGISEFVEPPGEISLLWSSIPADVETIGEFLAPVKDWFAAAKKGDFVLIQGEFGAVYNMVCHAFQVGLVPVYATTERTAIEKVKSDGSVEIIRTFRHKRFRKYEH